MVRILWLHLLSQLFHRTAFAFVIRSGTSRHNFLYSVEGTTSTTGLFGISEWQSLSSVGSSNRTILGLPFLLGDSEDAAPLVLGDSRNFPLKPDSPTSLIEEARKDHCSILGGILVQDESVLPVFPLLEVTKYSLEEGVVTLKCVGRAELVSLQQRENELLEGECTQLSYSDSTDGRTGSDLTECNELVKDIEQLLATRSDQNAMYQKAFWTSLAASGYNPTSLLTRDPFSTNSEKEVEAASWASLACLEDPAQQYEAFSAETVLERLQIIRRGLLVKGLDMEGTGTDDEAEAHRNSSYDDQESFQ